MVGQTSVWVFGQNDRLNIFIESIKYLLQSIDYISLTNVLFLGKEEVNISRKDHNRPVAILMLCVLFVAPCCSGWDLLDFIFNSVTS